jgi:hypothetical protein
MPYSLVVEPSDVGSEPVVVLLTVITLPINYYNGDGTFQNCLRMLRD